MKCSHFDIIQYVHVVLINMCMSCFCFKYVRWIDAEVTLEKIIARAHIVLQDSCEVAADRIEFPANCTLRDFYMEVKLEVRHSLFFMETCILFGRDKKT